MPVSPAAFALIVDQIPDVASDSVGAHCHKHSEAKPAISHNELAPGNVRCTDLVKCLGKMNCYSCHVVSSLLAMLSVETGSAVPAGGGYFASLHGLHIRLNSPPDNPPPILIFTA